MLLCVVMCCLSFVVVSWLLSLFVDCVWLLWFVVVCCCSMLCVDVCCWLLRVVWCLLRVVCM